MVGGKEGRVGEAALGATMVIGRIRPALTEMWAVHLGIGQHRADGEPDRDVGGAFQRHVDRPVGHLRRRAGEIDHQRVVLLGGGDDDRQLLLGGIVAVEIAVDRRLGAIDAVRQAWRFPGLQEDHDDAFRETGELPGRKVDPRR
jgi:hypothetical protein